MSSLSSVAQQAECEGHDCDCKSCGEQPNRVWWSREVNIRDPSTLRGPTVRSLPNPFVEEIKIPIENGGCCSSSRIVFQVPGGMVPASPLQESSNVVSSGSSAESGVLSKKEDSEGKFCVHGAGSIPLAGPTTDEPMKASTPAESLIAQSSTTGFRGGRVTSRGESSTGESSKQCYGRTLGRVTVNGSGTPRTPELLPLPLIRIVPATDESTKAGTPPAAASPISQSSTSGFQEGRVVSGGDSSTGKSSKGCYRRRRSHVCLICDKGFLQQSHLMTHLKSHMIRKERCQKCGRRFVSPEDLRSHAATHTERGPFGCDQCDKRYFCKRALKTHVLINHSGTQSEQQSKCSGNGNDFVCKVELAGPRPIKFGSEVYLCVKCMQVFYSKEEFVQHSLFHLDKYPLKCPVCGAASRRKDTLSGHIQYAHQKSEVEADSIVEKLAVGYALNNHH